MALDFNAEYPANSTAPSGDYPWGSGKNESVPGAADGTPGEKAWMDDFLGFFQGLLTRGAGVSPSGNADTVLVSDYHDAMEDLYLQYAHSRALFAWASVTQITITGGAYTHFGTVNQVLKINSAITYTIGTPGTSQWQYIYLDDSAIVTASTNVITSSEITNSPTAPTYSNSKKGWYNGPDRCIFAVYIDGAGEVTLFHHDGGEYVLWDVQPSITPFAPSTSWTNTSIAVGVPAFSTKANVTLIHTYVNTSTAILKWRVDGTAGAGVSVSQAFTAAEPIYSAITVLTDSVQVIEIRLSSSANNTVGPLIDGWYFPAGM